MRIHEGNFAYDLEQVRDPLTQVLQQWKYTIYRLRPMEERVASGEATDRAEAEKKAKAALARLAGEERTHAA
jgi:hypothetical protein